MARQIVILETRKNTDGVTQLNGFFWFPISVVANRVPRPGFVSAGVSLPIPPSQDETTALETGAVREEGVNITFAASSTNAQIKSDLLRRYTDRAAAIAAEPAVRQYYGVSYDGTSWSA